MKDTGEVIQAILIGLIVANFLLNTCRVLQVIELCTERLVFKNNKEVINRILTLYKTLHLVLFEAYCLIYDDASAIDYGRKLLVTLQDYGEKALVGELALRLATLYESQSKLVEAKELFEKAVNVTREGGDRSGEALCHEKLGAVLYSLGEYVKSTVSFENALVIRMESGDKTGQARNYSNLGGMFISLGKCVKAKEYLEKALAITKETGDREIEEASYGNLGTLFQCVGEYFEAKECHEKSLAIKKEIGDVKGEASTYVNLGDVFRSLGEYVRAKEYLEKALVINQEVGNRIDEAKCYGNLGTVLQHLGQYVQARDYHEKSLQIKQEIGDSNGEASSYTNLGSVFLSFGEYVKAKDYYEKAREIKQKTGDRMGEAICYENLGTVFRNLGKHLKAKDYYEKALSIKQEIADRRGEAISYGNLGTVFQCIGDYTKAKDYHENALKIRHEIGDINGEATSYDNLGTVFQHLGEYSKANDYYGKALTIHREIGNRSGEASSYLNLGTLFQYLGEYFKANDHYEKALTITQEIGERKEALCYGNLGTVFNHLGEYVKAKDYHEKALTIKQEIGDRRGEASSYANLGTVFHSLGEYFDAKDYYEKALAIKREIGDRNGEALCYANLGAVFRSLRKYKKAHDYLKKAVATAKGASNRKVEGTSYGTIGSVYFAIGDHRKAKEHFEKAVSISEEIRDSKGLAKIYEKLGSLFTVLGEYIKAKEYLKKALAMSKEIGDGEEEFLSLCRLVLVTFLDGDVMDALKYLLSCIRKCEELRGVLGDNDQFKICFAQQHVFPYWILSVMFRSAGEHNQALCVLELGRARALADTLSHQYSVENQISADAQSWAGIEKIIEKHSNSTCLYISYTSRDIVLWIIKRNGVLKVQEREFSDPIEGGLVRTLDDFFADSFRQFGILPKGSCEDRCLSENQREHTSTEEGSFVPLRLVEEEENQEPEPNLFFCYNMIIAPVVDLLDKPHIIIVPDRSLYRVPFAALQDKNGKYLSETFRIRIVPSLTTLGLIQDSPDDYHSQTGALIVGDPEVGEVIYKGCLKNITPLPCARKEAEMIGRLLGIEPLIGQQATKPAVLQRIHSVSLIHFAAHGNAERGEIALAPLRPINRTPREQDFLLSMNDISQVQLRAKLVVLSCCHSGQGQIRTEGVVGIARAFLGSGARSVLVALWALEDSATEQLMKRFYAHLVRGESATESLHQAMKWMRRNGFSRVSQWAPFMLIGDDVTFNFGT